MVASWDRRLAILNPDYELVAGGEPFIDDPSGR
jgi:hypothetical protein